MAYAQIPKDLTEVKTKVMFGLTKRQLICFAIAAAIGFPLYAFARRFGTTVATITIVLVTMPAAAFALYTWNGLYLEKILKNMIKARYLRPKKRPFVSKNLYEMLEIQAELNEEVRRIVQEKGKGKGTAIRRNAAAKQADTKAKKGDRGGKTKAARKT